MATTDQPHKRLEPNRPNEARFELVTMIVSGQVVSRQWVHDPDLAMQQCVRMTKHDLGPTHGQGSYLALKVGLLKLDASRVYEGGGTYRVQYSKDGGMRAFFEAEKALGAFSSAASQTLSPDEVLRSRGDRDMSSPRSEAALNDPMAAAHPELPKAERVMAEEQMAQHAVTDKGELRRLAIQRAEEAKIVAETLGLKSGQARRSNRIESDEVFTAQQREVGYRIPPEILQTHKQVEGKFYHRRTPDQTAFQDRGNKLETQSDSEAVAENMVSIAHARGWDEINVSGSESFRQKAWTSAASKGMHVKGYTPTDLDKEAVERQRNTRPRLPENIGHSSEKARFPNDGDRETSRATDANQVGGPENAERAKTFQTDFTPASGVHKHPELAGAYATVAVIERKMDADGLSPQARAIVSQRVRQNIVNSIERGELPSVTVLDKDEKSRDNEREAEQ